MFYKPVWTAFDINCSKALTSENSIYWKYEWIKNSIYEAISLEENVWKTTIEEDSSPQTAEEPLL